MEKLQQQVRLAQRRLNQQRFLELLPWCLLASFSAACVAVLVHKWFPTPVDPWSWNVAWLASAFVVGLLVAVAWTYATRHATLAAALEVDRRFGLKERVSSSLALTHDQRDTEIGRAVIGDAQRRVEKIDVADRFQVTLGRRILLPLVPALLAFAAAFFIGEQGIDPKVQATPTDRTEQQQVKRSADALRKKIERRRKQLREMGLKDAEESLQELNQALDDLDKKSQGSRKQAMIKLNNLTDKLQQRRKKLSGSDEVRRQLNKLKNLKKGPADKLARAMKNGKFGDALDEIKALQKKLADGKMTDKEKKKVADQLDQMKNKMQEIADAHKKAQQDLKQRIDEAKDRGDGAEAGKLQQALDKLQQQQPQMDQLQDMASKLGKVSKAMQQGNDPQAQQALQELAENLDAVQQELDELETVEGTLDEIMECKNAMNCEECAGAGCGACGGGDKPGRGQGGGNGEGGDGLGAAKAGRGRRPLGDGDTSSYDSRVRAKVGAGKAVVTGLADGPNAKGRVRAALQEEFESQRSGPADPLTGQRLPRSHQRQVEEYFEALRGEERAGGK